MWALHLALDHNEMPAPDQLIISRLCEEFPGCTPGQIRRELENDSDGLMFDVVSIRSYVRLKRQLDARKPGDPPIPASQMLDWLLENTERFVQLYPDKAQQRLVEQLP